MAQKMKPIPLQNLLEWIFNELINEQSIFGIPKKNFFKKTNGNYFDFIDKKIETPFGPAAGPHTQLAHNIITSYLVGGRFIELKTVQILDELEIEKPCIYAADEGYNVEWSQELTLNQSFDEYLKAWLLIHLIKNLFSSSKSNDGFVFNMSVGYNLEGIKSHKVDQFIEKIKDAKSTELFNQYLNKIYLFFKENQELQKFISISQLENFLSNISSKISDNVTLSTMHGCPSEEIEEIAKYLIAEKNLHTFVKLNPTLLGYERVREILNQIGYGYINLKEESFQHDLKFDEAIPMIKRLSEFAKKHNRKFGIKLSNTLGVVNTSKVLPGEEMYMSGRSLFPLTINLAYVIAKEINDELHISYSGGANILNAKKIVEAGIFPVTFATDLLKPGGYLRLAQIATDFENDTNFIQSTSEKIDLDKLKILCEEALNHPYYKKDFKSIEYVKINYKLPSFDCYIAPCEIACPIHQDVSEYVYLASQKRFDEAFEVIIEKNPLPHITGYICDHQCMTKCNRVDYDYPVVIRELKKFVTEKAFENYINKINSQSKTKNGIKVGIIGAGPAGLSAAYFLARVGFDVTIFEKTDKAGGTVRHTIPQFRIPQEVIDNDIEFIKKFGVKVIYNTPSDIHIEDLKAQGFKYIFIGIGAEIPNELKLNSSNKNILDALDFLKRFNKNEKFILGKNVIVVGGGNSAMDAARAAKRIDGVENVTIVYRRTIQYMPADREELEAAINDGIKILELLQPIEFDGKVLRCQKMKLGDFDSDGRRKSIPIENEFIEIEADTIITAIGERTDYNYLRLNKISLDDKQNIIVNPETNETLIENVFVGGDTLRGPATVIEAVADGKKVAEAIIKKEKIEINFELKKNYKQEMNEKAVSVHGFVK
ncbi:MAG: putative selenate reductase subunit YgfK, partial [Ignavibacteria bacterium]|nr:putative selenate reductase subunit YgfK [Ignavibacteria bacterium]